MTRAPLCLVSACAVACSVTSCGSSAPPAAVPRADPAIPYASVWSADRDVDLFGRGAELIRAAVEAGEVNEYYGQNDTARAYPGYRQAIGPENLADGRVGSENRTRWPDPEPVPRGMEYRHISDFRANNHVVTAEVCEYFIPVPTQPDHPLARPWYDGTIVHVQLENTASSPGRPGIRDTTPGRHDPRAHLPPTWNVFGSWRITTLNSLDPTWNPNSYPAGCLPFSRLRLPFAGVDRRGFPQVPAGARLPTGPVGAQFPEWIGP